MWVGFEKIQIISRSFEGYNYIRFPFNVKSIVDEKGKDLLFCFAGDMFFPPMDLKLLIVNNYYRYYGDECAGNVCYDVSGYGKHAERK